MSLFCDRPGRSLTWTRTALHARWAIIGVASWLVYDLVPLQLLLGAMGALLFANLLLLRLASSKAESAHNLFDNLRLLDGLLISSAMFLPALSGGLFWLLGVPVLLGEAMSSHSAKRVATLGGAMIALTASAIYYHTRSVEAMILPMTVYAASAVVGATLARFERREGALQHGNQRLKSVLDCGLTFASSSHLQAATMHTLKAAIAETGADCGYIMLLENEETGPLKAELAYSLEGEFEFPESLDLGFGISGYVAKMGQPIVVNEGGDDYQDFDGVTAGVRSAISVPLATRGYSGVGQGGNEVVLGVMTLLSTQDAKAFNNQDMDMLRTLAAMIAVAISSARMEEKQQATFLKTLETLANALEARDEYTQGHSQRVCEVSMMLGERMGFSKEAIEELRIGTVLHDIGKIGIPDAVLNKRSRLTDEEFAVMKTHPVIGYEICKPLTQAEGVLMLIRNHHEKLDGGGYPDGLKGGELPLPLRIVCVADAFDAMSSRRPYRGVMEREKVLSELSRGAGTQFDPVVVEELKAILDSERMTNLYSRFWSTNEELAA